MQCGEQQGALSAGWNVFPWPHCLVDSATVRPHAVVVTFFTVTLAVTFPETSTCARNARGLGGHRVPDKQRRGLNACQGRDRECGAIPVRTVCLSTPISVRTATCAADTSLPQDAATAVLMATFSVLLSSVVYIDTADTIERGEQTSLDASRGSKAIV